MRLAGKVVIVTGAAQGIGLATARVFHAEGARLMLADLNEEAGRRACAALDPTGEQAAFAPTDVSSSAEVRRMVEATVERFGKLDAIFNNAGIAMDGSVLDVTEEQFDRVFAVNVKGVFLGCKYALPHLLANPNGGAILNMSSNGGLIGRPADPVYSATKHAVLGLTKSLALAYADRRIRVNALCPGPIDTPMSWVDLAPGEDREAYMRRVLAVCPTPRMAPAEEVARTALFLVSDEAPFISGVGLAIDGAKAAGIFKEDRYRLDFALL